jgi:uncharacterized membrane protein YebE (DUF533 family)
MGGMPGGGGSPFDMVGKILGAVFGGGSQQGQQGPGSAGGFPMDILKTIAGSVFSGAGGQAGPAAGPGGIGAGSMSVFGAIAMQAIEMAKQMMSGAQSGAVPPVHAPAQPQARPGTIPASFEIDDVDAIIAGLRKPANTQEQQQLLDVATLTVKAMINAAKADGRIDEQETQRLVGKLQEDGVSEAEQRFVAEEMRKPLETDAIVRAVHNNQQLAAQIYTASLMAIQVDTDAERRYLAELASKLGMNQQVVALLHGSVGLA